MLYHLHPSNCQKLKSPYLEDKDRTNLFVVRESIFLISIRTTETLKGNVGLGLKEIVLKTTVRHITHKTFCHKSKRSYVCFHCFILNIWCSPYPYWILKKSFLNYNEQKLTSNERNPTLYILNENALSLWRSF